MQDSKGISGSLSPWWRQAVILVLVLGFSVLIWQAARTYTDAPPIPDRVVSVSGETVFTGDDILAGQQVFLKYGLMENGTIWGHGAYLGPDFSAEYLHTLAIDTAELLAKQRYNGEVKALDSAQRSAVKAEVQALLKQNRYDPSTRRLTFTGPEVASYRKQVQKWSAYLSKPAANAGLPTNYITDPTELRQLTSFFAWTAWASVANRPGKSYSYTNNFPYDPEVGNTATSDAVLWSGLSLIALLAGTALVLFAFGRFDFLGWKGQTGHAHPQMVPGVATASQRATIKYFALVGLLFFAQVLVGGATAHYRADPGGFYGIDLSAYFPSNILRTWHLQLAVFWIATSGGGTLNNAMAVFLGIALSTAVLAYIFTIPATITLRRKFPDVRRPFVVPGGKFGLWLCVILAEAGIILTGFTLLWPGLIDKVLGQQYSIMDSWGVSRKFFELTTLGSFLVILLIGVVFWAWGRAQTKGSEETVEELIEGAVVED